MIPTRRTLWSLFILLLAAIAISFYPPYKAYLVNTGYAFLAVLLADWLVLSTRHVLQAERKVMHALSLGTWTTVELTLHNRYRYPVRLSLYDHVPTAMEHDGLPLSVRIPPRNWVRVSYRVRPIQRGPAQFSALQMRLDSVLGLWQKNRIISLPSDVRVYPNFSSVMKYTLLATDQRLNQMGILKKRRRGEGLDFHQLREYRDVIRYARSTGRLRHACTSLSRAIIRKNATSR